MAIVCNNKQITNFFLLLFQMLVFCLIHCLCIFVTDSYGFDLIHLSQPNSELSNHRFKREKPFRPLFVYKQQQKERQAKWKLEAAEKLVQQQQLQNSIRDYYKHQTNPVKGYYTYSLIPSYADYQTTVLYQANPNYQLKNYQYYPVNSYGSNIYPTFGQLYANQPEYYYDKYESQYDK